MSNGIEVGSGGIGRVRQYYRENQILYTLFWTERRALSMNVGLWTAGTRTRVRALENQNALIGELLQPGPADVVLDAGCGTGGTSIWLAGRFGSRVYGITLCERQAALATRYAGSRRVGDRVKFAVMDFTNAAFPDGSFSRVFASESVCHTEHKEQFVADAFRLLKPGGRLVVVDGFLRTHDLTERQRAPFVDWCEGWAVPNLATVEEFDSTLRRRGFDAVDFRDLTAYILPSARRVYAWGLVSQPVVGLLRLLGLATATQSGHAVACRRLHGLVTQHVCRFGVFSAIKP